MKKLLSVLIILLTTLNNYTHAQESHIEESYYSVQTTLLGIWVNNETKIGDKIALRSEIGFDSGTWVGSSHDGFSYALAPVITIEPRLYYNLEKRKQRNKNISRNAGNFLSIKTSYHPDWFTISNRDLKVTSDISIIPTWGLKRNIGNSKFNYEAAFGLGYRYYFRELEWNPAYNLSFRIGYSF